MNRWISAPKIPIGDTDIYNAKVAHVLKVVADGHCLVIDYQESDGNILSEIAVNVKEMFRKQGYPHIYFHGYSYLHEEERTFRIDRILRTYHGQ